MSVGKYFDESCGVIAERNTRALSSLKPLVSKAILIKVLLTLGNPSSNNLNTRKKNLIYNLFQNEIVFNLLITLLFVRCIRWKVC